MNEQGSGVCLLKMLNLLVPLSWYSTEQHR